MARYRFRTAVLVGVVSLSVCFPSMAWATIEGNQTPATEEEIASAIASGELSQDETSQTYSLRARSGESRVPSAVSVSDYAGPTMYETAAREALAAYPEGSSSAILVGPGDAWIDALSAAGLARSKGPILFTLTERLQDSTKSALLSLGVKHVVIAGGTAAVSDDVVRELSDIGISLEKRLGGADCYGTQMAIYQYGLDNSLWTKDLVIFATGSWFGDALSVSPIAYAKSAPIFLVDDSKDLRPEQCDMLIDAAMRGYNTAPIIVGGTAAVGEKLSGFADYLSTLAQGSAGSSQRLWGATQYETSVAIAEWAVSSQGFSWNNAAITTGLLPYDALAGAVLQGTSQSVMLLAADEHSSTISALGGYAEQIQAIRFFGGEEALNMRVRMGVADTLEFPYAALPNFKVFIDAGHGWNDSNNGIYDPGATMRDENGEVIYEEATLTKDLAERVGAILRDEYGIEVYVNNQGGWYALRHAKAIEQGCDALVSIHFNAGGGTGSESLIHDYNASYLSPLWQSTIHPFFVEGTGLRDRGMKEQTVAILGGYLPATLLEIAFIDSQFDMDQYESRKDEVAHKIAEGIVS